MSVGLARTGSHIGHQSGDFVISFTTANKKEHISSSLLKEETVINDEDLMMPWLFQAVIEAVEEAVLNALFKAETLHGRDGNYRLALPIEEVLEIYKKEKME